MIGRKGTLTSSKGNNKIVLPMYPPKYHGEIQEEDLEEISEPNSHTGAESTKMVDRHQPSFKVQD